MLNLDPSSAFAALGVYAVTVIILAVCLRTVWQAYQRERAERIEDAKVVLPAMERVGTLLSDAARREAERSAEDRILAATQDHGRKPRGRGRGG